MTDRTKNTILQVTLFLFSTVSLWFIGGDKKYQWIGFAVGILSQPVWFIVSWRAKQWATAALCFVYGFCHLRGLINHW